MKKLYNEIVEKVKDFDNRTICNFVKDNSELNIYFPKYNGIDLKTHLERVDELSKNLIIFIQSYYYYQVVSFKEEIKDVAIIKRIGIKEIKKTNRNSHLQRINLLKDLYV